MADEKLNISNNINNNVDYISDILLSLNEISDIINYIGDGYVNESFNSADMLNNFNEVEENINNGSVLSDIYSMNKVNNKLEKSTNGGFEVLNFYDEIDTVNNGYSKNINNDFERTIYNNSSVLNKYFENINEMFTVLNNIDRGYSNKKSGNNLFSEATNQFGTDINMYTYEVMNYGEDDKNIIDTNKSTNFNIDDCLKKNNKFLNNYADNISMYHSEGNSYNESLVLENDVSSGAREKLFDDLNSFNIAESFIKVFDYNETNRARSGEDLYNSFDVINKGDDEFDFLLNNALENVTVSGISGDSIFKNFSNFENMFENITDEKNIVDFINRDIVEKSSSEITNNINIDLSGMNNSFQNKDDGDYFVNYLTNELRERLMSNL